MNEARPGQVFKGVLSSEALVSRPPADEERLDFFDPDSIYARTLEGLGVETCGDLRRLSGDAARTCEAAQILMEYQSPPIIIDSVELRMYNYWVGTRGHGARSFFVLQEGNREGEGFSWRGVPTHTENDEPNNLEVLFANGTSYDMEAILNRSQLLESPQQLADFIANESLKVHRIGDN